MWKNALWLPRDFAEQQEMNPFFVNSSLVARGMERHRVEGDYMGNNFSKSPLVFTLNSGLLKLTIIMSADASASDLPYLRLSVRRYSRDLPCGLYVIEIPVWIQR